MNDQPVVPKQRDEIVTTAIECALVHHPKVSEAVVVPIVLHVKGKALSAFIKLKEGVSENQEVRKELADYIRERIGPSGVPETMHFGPNLPKTRSGKIMRDILTEMAETQLGL